MHDQHSRPSPPETRDAMLDEVRTIIASDTRTADEYALAIDLWWSVRGRVVGFSVVPAEIALLKRCAGATACALRERSGLWRVLDADDTTALYGMEQREQAAREREEAMAYAQRASEQAMARLVDEAFAVRAA